MEGTGPDQVQLGDNLDILEETADDCIDLIYVDPPFNTGGKRTLRQIRTVQDPEGDRTGFQGKRYRSIPVGRISYLDVYDDYLEFLEPRLRHFRRVLSDSGTLYFHIDSRESHYCKILLDSVFGRDCFLNEVIWAYDYGGRSKKRWPAKHDNILVYVKNPKSYYFSTDEIERIPYMAPGLVGPEKAARGKLPTDTWWHTIVPPGGKERTGYPTQKPLGILRRIIQASSPPGGTVADYFAGSGTTGVAARELGRRFLLVDSEPEAVRVMAERFRDIGGVEIQGLKNGAADADVSSPIQQRLFQTRG